MRRSATRRLRTTLLLRFNIFFRLIMTMTANPFRYKISILSIKKNVASIIDIKVGGVTSIVVSFIVTPDCIITVSLN